jgi:hypothetical protein
MRNPNPQQQPHTHKPSAATPSWIACMIQAGIGSSTTTISYGAKQESFPMAFDPSSSSSKRTAVVVLSIVVVVVDADPF